MASPLGYLKKRDLVDGSMGRSGGTQKAAANNACEAAKHEDTEESLYRVISLQKASGALEYRQHAADSASQEERFQVSDVHGLLLQDKTQKSGLAHLHGRTTPFLSYDFWKQPAQEEQDTTQNDE